MMGHLAVPGLGDGQTPASILPEAYGLAREALQYDGTIYTDDIGGMAAISDSLPLADAVITSSPPAPTCPCGPPRQISMR